MSSISPQQIASLRARTGVGIMAVKSALEEAGGDEEKAIEILRKTGAAQAVKKADREQSEGGIFTAKEGNKAVLVTIKCETDFVGRSEGFVKLGEELAASFLAEGEGFSAKADEKIQAAVLEFGENISLGETATVEAPVVGTYIHSNRKIGVIVGIDKGTEEQAMDAAMHAAAMNPQFAKPEDVSSEDLASERNIWEEQLAKEGKPAEIMEKIIAGKEKKFREEQALISQAFVKDPNVTVAEMLGDGTVVEYVRLSLS